MRQTDPEKVGEFLAWAREKYPDRLTHPLSMLADSIPWRTIPEVDKGASLCQETVAEYRRELEEREDKYAKAALRDIDATGKVQGFDEAGN